MKRLPLVILAILGIAACSPAPRAQSYFETHADDARQVVEDCAQGRHRGAECRNADAALARLKAQDRLKSYRQGF